MIRYLNKISFVENWQTPMAPINLDKACEELRKQDYYVDSHSYVKILERDYNEINMARKENLPGFKELVMNIVLEHYEITKLADSNLNYLWYMYGGGTGGSKSGEYRPFIFMSELQLLKEMGYTNEKEIDNIWSMLNSEDSDNFNLAYMAINNMRNLRIKEHGLYNKNSVDYEHIVKIYNTQIVNHLLFLKTGS